MVRPSQMLGGHRQLLEQAFHFHCVQTPCPQLWVPGAAGLSLRCSNPALPSDTHRTQPTQTLRRD